MKIASGKHEIDVTIFAKRLLSWLNSTPWGFIRGERDLYGKETFSNETPPVILVSSMSHNPISSYPGLPGWAQI